MEGRSARLTAIRRMKMSAPMKWLVDQNLIKQPALDFGCGRGEDAYMLDIYAYDPYFQPNMPRRKFKTITCIYVLNTQEEFKEQFILERIEGKLLPGGKAYIAVRRDIKREGYTSRGTYQRMVILDLPVIKQVTGRFVIYGL